MYETIRFPLIGKLEIVKSLFWYDGPLFFVCKNNDNKLLLTICISRDGNEYIATEVNDSIVNDIECNKIEMRQPFIEPIGKLYHFYYRENSDIEEIYCKNIRLSELPIDMLPGEGIYFSK